jgi:signal transduction histidine kinase
MTPRRGVGTVPTMPSTTARLAEHVRRLPPVVVDAALAVVVGIVTVTSIIVTDANDDSERMTSWGWTLLAVQLLPLVWRRRSPLVVAFVTGMASLAFGMANLPDPAIQFPLVLALYSAAAYRPRSMTVPLVLSVIVVVTGAAVIFDEQADAADLAVNYLVGIGSWVVGDSTRSQRERNAWLAERQHEEARRAAAEERVRIARDLHDVVAHHISVIVVQAEAAQEVLAVAPERAERAMRSVADTARAALGELRRMLGVLRSEAGLAPQPDLAGVADLVASVDRAGLAVELRTWGSERPVGGVIGLTAYRIVQEALTNVLRHAHAERACVELGFDDDALVVRVTDDGRGTGEGSSVGGGQGLVGMRERVAMVGGQLRIGPGSDGGFVVDARLPLLDLERA